MASKASSAQADKDLRPLLIDMSQRQVELRKRLNDHLNATGDTLGTTASQAGIGWNALAGLRDSTVVLKGGSGLEGLCRLLDCVELGNEIVQISEQVPDKYLTLALRSVEVMDLTFELLDSVRSYASVVTQAEYASAFGAYASTVAGALTCSQTSLGELEDAAARQSIRTILHGDLGAALDGIRARSVAEKEQSARQLEELVVQLAARYGGRSATARVLNVSRNSLKNATTGSASLKQIKKLTVAAESLLQSRQPVQTEQGVSDATSDDSDLPGYVPEAAIAVGGITTSEGVPHVLTEASFQQLEAVPIVALRESLLTALRVTRLQLNIGSQLKDPIARKILQEEIGPEVQELELAIRQFTFAHPNELLSLYESQRQHWSTDKSSGSKSNKGKGSH